MATEREGMIDLIAHEVIDKAHYRDGEGDVEVYFDPKDFATYLVERLVKSGSISAVAAEIEANPPESPDRVERSDRIMHAIAAQEAAVQIILTLGFSETTARALLASLAQHDPPILMGFPDEFKD